jgi:hypothetical protein
MPFTRDRSPAQPAHCAGWSPARIGLALLGALGVALALPAQGEASVERLHAARVHAGVATFELRTIEPSDIRSAHLAGPRRRHFSLRHIRSSARRGSLRVRVAKRGARRWERRHARDLELVLITARDASRSEAGRTKPRKHDGSSTGGGSGGTSEGGSPDGGGDGGGGIVGGPGGTSCGGLESFAAGSWPAGCWRPYSDSSPFNIALPTSPRLAPNSSAIVSRLVGDSTFNSGPGNIVAGTADTTDDWDHPLYFGKLTDPAYLVDCTRSWGTCEPERYGLVHIPLGARPARGGDGHLAVIQPNGDEVDLWQAEKGADPQRGTTPSNVGTTLSTSWGGVTSVLGDGLGSDATKAHFGLLAGVIRAEELAAGKIDHALFMVVRCTNGTEVYPSVTGSAPHTCSAEGKSNSNAPAMGQMLQLDPSYNVDALSVPTWKKTILRAMQQHGLVIGDSGGGGWGVQALSGSTYTSFGFRDALVTFAQSAGVSPYYDGSMRKTVYPLHLRDGVDWSRLRVVDPCVVQRLC